MVRRETRVGLGQDCVGCDHVDNSFHPVIVLRQHQLSLCQAQGKLCWEWNRIGLISMCDLTLSCHLVRNQFWVCFTDIPWPWMLFMIDQVLGEVEPVSLRQPMERYSVTVQPHTLCLVKEHKDSWTILIHQCFLPKFELTWSNNKQLLPLNTWPSGPGWRIWRERQTKVNRLTSLSRPDQYKKKQHYHLL